MSTTAQRIIQRRKAGVPDFPDHKTPGRTTTTAPTNRAERRAASRPGHHLAKWDHNPIKRRNR